MRTAIAAPVDSRSIPSTSKSAPSAVVLAMEITADSKMAAPKPMGSGVMFMIPPEE